MKSIEQIALETAQEMGLIANSVYEAFAKQFLDAWLAQQEPVAWVDTVTSPRPRCITNLDYRSVTEAESGVEYVPLFLAPPPAIPEDMCLVPLEPTERMLEEAYVFGNCMLQATNKCDPALLYKAMIAAAPKGEQE